MRRNKPLSSRRAFIGRAGKLALGIAAAPGLIEAAKKKEQIGYPQGKAAHCIFIWLGGGAAHVDTRDIKRQGDGKKIPGSAYAAIDTAIPGVRVCEHLKQSREFSFHPPGA